MVVVVVHVQCITAIESNHLSWSTKRMQKHVSVSSSMTAAYRFCDVTWLEVTISNPELLIKFSAFSICGRSILEMWNWSFPVPRDFPPIRLDVCNRGEMARENDFRPDVCCLIYSNSPLFHLAGYIMFQGIDEPSISLELRPGSEY